MHRLALFDLVQTQCHIGDALNVDLHLHRPGYLALRLHRSMLDGAFDDGHSGRGVTKRLFSEEDTFQSDMVVQRAP